MKYTSFRQPRRTLVGDSRQLKAPRARYIELCILNDTDVRRNAHFSSHVRLVIEKKFGFICKSS